jgi:hypothetical protein
VSGVDLVQWLGDRLTEDEELARAAADELDGLSLGGEWRYDGRSVETIPERTMVAVGSQDFMEPGTGTHIAAHDPARVLREIEAKRAVVARYEFACREAIRVDLSEEERETWIRVGGALQAVVIQLAAPYADRPGYRAEEWAP